MRGPSGTARLTAVARALHREEPPPWVLDDFLALGLAGEQAPALRAQLVRELAREDLLAFSRWVCVRARLPEDIVHFGPEEARSTYFQGRSDVQFGGAQRLLVATVAAP